jgi:GAF domain-containing protein
MGIEGEDRLVIEALERVRGALVGDAERALDVSRLADAAHALVALREERAREGAAHAEIMRLLRSEAFGRGEVGDVVREATRIATGCLRVGRSSVWRYTNDRKGLVCLDLYLSAEGAHERGVELSASEFPAYFQALRVDGVIAAHDANRDPRTREFSADYLTPLGIGAMLDVPIRVRGDVMGVLCNEHLGDVRQWSEGDERLAWMLADLLGLAVETGERECLLAELRAAVGASTDDDACGMTGVVS